MKKKLAVVVLTVAVAALGSLAPGAAFAGASTDAALGLGAFAVFNQILGGTGIFARPAPVAVAPPPPVYYQPAPVVVAPPPPPVYYQPAPVVVAPPAPVYYAPAPVVVREGWCPPGLARQGRCGRWAHERWEHRHHRD